MTARVTRRWPRIGRAHEAWPGITISGVVILAAAVIGDALGEPPHGSAVLVLGYALRRFERRKEEDRNAP